MAVKKIKKMVLLQKKLNDETNSPSWVYGISKHGNKVNWLRCIHMEGAELIDSFPWKHWKDLNAPADIENATTTLNGGTLGSTKLSSVTKNVKLYFGEDKSTTNVFTALKVGDNGKFYYYNNGTTLGKFTIRVPLEVTYKWGTIYTEVDLNINKTIQN